MAEAAVHTFRWNNHRSSSLSAATRLLPLHRSHSRSRQPTPKQPRTICQAVEIKAPTANLKKKKNRYDVENLTTWLLKQEQSGHLDSELTIVLSSITLACKQISSLLQRSSIINLTGTQGTVNIQGEDQKKLDVIANEVCLHFLGYTMYTSVIKTPSLLLQLFCNCLRSTGRTGIIASEEEDIPVAVEETYSGNYIVVFDPIDGSANIDTSLTTGSIFGIYAPDKQCLLDLDDDSTTLDQAREKCIVSVCQPGNNLLAAGYCLYSSSVVFTLSIGRGVYSFTLDPTYGEFVLTHENIKIPKSGRTYSFNEGNYDLFDERLQRYLDELRKPGDNGKPYSGRYIGCLVGEIHRMLLVGGIYGNPDNRNSRSGNLRLLYECAPMSYLVEQAGGKAHDGRQRILDIMPTKIHQRSPIFIGSPDEIDKLEKYMSKE